MKSGGAERNDWDVHHKKCIRRDAALLIRHVSVTKCCLVVKCKDKDSWKNAEKLTEDTGLSVHHPWYFPPCIHATGRRSVKQPWPSTLCGVLESSNKSSHFLTVFSQPLYCGPAVLRATRFCFYSPLSGYLWSACLLPSGVYLMTVLVIFLGSLRSTWPICFQLVPLSACIVAGVGKADFIIYYVWAQTFNIFLG